MSDGRRTLLLVGVAGLLFTFGYSQLVLLPLFLGNRGADIGAVGMLLSAMPFTAMLMRPFGGHLVSRHGGRSVFVVSCIAFATLVPAYALVTPARLPLFALLRALQGISAACITNALTILASQSDIQSHRARAIGRVGVVTIFGSIFSPLVAEFLYREVGDTSIFFVSGGCCLAGGLVALLLPKQHRPSTQLARFTLLSHRRTLFGRNMRLLLGAGLLASTASGSLSTFMPLYAQERGLGAGSIFFVTNSLCSALIMLPTAGLSDRVGRRRVAIPSMLLAMGALLAIVDLRAAAMIAVAGILHGISSGLSGPALTALTLDTQVEEEAAGPVAIGLYFMTSDAGLMLGASSFGWIASSLGFGRAYALFSVLYLLSAGLIAGMREKPNAPAELRRPIFPA